MSETIIPSVLTRRGNMAPLHNVPELLPATLGNFAWPKAYAKRLAEADKAAQALYDAHAAWELADYELEHEAPGKDQAALEAAIRAGQDDPGTPATDAADRAEHVAWTRMQLALEDARAATHKAVLQDYIDTEAQHLAAHELARETAHAEAAAKAAEIMAEATDRANMPGAASTAIKSFVAARWNEQDDKDTLLVADGPNDHRRHQIMEYNAAILERWKRQAEGKAEAEAAVTA